jgi:hypothetical protein
VTASGIVTLGRAVTHGQALPLGIDDPVIAARAVRRALADGGLHAADVSAIVLASPHPVAPDAFRGFVRRALGPYRDTLYAQSVVELGLEAEALADAACAALETAVTIDGKGVSVAVGLAADGTTVARCVTGVREPPPSAA